MVPAASSGGRGSTMPSARWPSAMRMSVDRPQSRLGGGGGLFELLALVDGESRLDAEQRGDAGDELTGGRNGVPASSGEAHGFRHRLRLVEHQQHDISRIVHREGTDKGIQAMVLAVATVDHLLRRSGLAANPQSRHI